MKNRFGVVELEHQKKVWQIYTQIGMLFQLKMSILETGDTLRDVQISNSMKLLQIRNGYHNVCLSRTVNVKLFAKRR